MTKRGDDTRDGTGESAAEAEAEAAAKAVVLASERAAFLLGWVKVALTPPPAGVGSSREVLGRRSVGAAGGNGGGNGNDGAGSDSGSTGEAQRGSAIGTQDTHDAGQINGNSHGNTRGRRARHGTTAVSNVSQSQPAVFPPPGAGKRDDRAGGGMPAEGSRLGVLPAGPGHVWFHVPSARLVEELPTSWVTFGGISGGILADVSRGW